MKVGIIGAGQLARMLALAGHPLGISCHCMAHSLQDSAKGTATLHVIDSHDNHAIEAFIRQVDVITFENENVDKDVLNILEKHAPVYPSIRAIKISQDRWLEKNMLRELGIPTVNFMRISVL